jgi:hypothetical protein
MRVLDSRNASTSTPATNRALSRAPSISRILRVPAPPAPAPAAAAAAPPVFIATRARPQQQAAAAPAGRRRAVAAAPAAAPPAAAGGYGDAAAARAQISKEQERLRQLILSEVLDSKPSVRFDDVAGLRSAKQALQEAVILPR